MHRAPDGTSALSSDPPVRREGCVVLARALTIHPPWVEWIIVGDKDVENRT
jgi:hypothetical protein